MNILLLGNDPSDQQWSVLEYGQQLAQHLADLLGARGRVTLCAPDTRWIGPWIRRSRVGRAAAMYWSRYVAYPGVLRGARADCYHILDHGNAWLIRHRDPSRTVVFCHDLIPLVLRHQYRSLWPWVSDRAFGQALAGMRRAAAILTNSECTKRDVVAHLGYPAEQICVVPLGIDPMARPPAGPEEVAAARAAFRLPEGALLLHVGQTAFYKNIEGLLHSLRLLCKQGEPVWLIRAGAWLSRRQRHLAGRLGVLDRIREFGPLPHDRLRQLYHAADILAYPSWYEGQGLPPLEAMASGVPVVASDRGALPETVGQAGLCVDPADPSALAGAIQRLLHNTALRAEMSARGVVRASEFTWITAARRTLQVYESVVTGSLGREA